MDRSGRSAQPPLRVAVLAPIAWRVPPRHYGPWERFVALLVDGLVDRGVEVTLFATADSQTRARLHGTAPRGYEEDPDVDARVWGGLHIAACFERAGDFDLIHNSFDFPPLTYSGLVATPVVTTIHGFSSERILPVYERYDGRSHYVAISEADRSPRLTYLATIHHGIDLAEFTPAFDPGDYLLFFGRIHPDKGTATAVDVARRAGLPLVIAGIVHDRAYFEERVAPHIDGEAVRYLGPVGPRDRSRLLAGARALLHLIDFAEPFGLSVVEAMACGTPVIAHPRGALPEIVTDGVDGFLVSDAEDAVAAVAAAAELDRRTVRATVERRFTAGRMVEDYIRAYRRVTGDHGPIPEDAH